MTWQRLTYGALAAAGLSITGALIWDSPRAQVRPVDVVEILEGLRERQAAVAASMGVQVVTQRVAAWVTDSVLTNFVQYAGETDLVTTNVVWGDAAPWAGTFPSSPGLYVWGTWTQLVASGFDGDASNFNGTYTLNTGTVGDADGVWYFLGTNGAPVVGGITATNTGPYWLYVHEADPARVLVDFGPRWGFVLGTYSSAGAATVGFTNFPAQYMPPDPDAAFGDFLTRMVGGGPLRFTGGNILGNSPGTWQYGDTIARDGWMRMVWHQGETVTAPVPSGAVAPVGTVDTNRLRTARAWTYEVRPDAVAWQIEQGLVTSICTRVRELVPSYVSGVSTSGSAQYLTVTGLWAQLSIGDGTNQFTREPALGTNAATYGAAPWQVYTQLFREVHAVLAAMTQTVRAASWGTNHTERWVEYYIPPFSEWDGYGGRPERMWEKTLGFYGDSNRTAQMFTLLPDWMATGCTARALFYLRTVSAGPPDVWTNDYAAAWTSAVTFAGTAATQTIDTTTWTADVGGYEAPPTNPAADNTKWNFWTDKGPALIQWRFTRCTD